MQERQPVHCLSFPEQLIGRTKEIEQLEKLYNTAAAGKSGTVLVKGYAGSGKSVMVRTFGKAVLHNGGVFITGKCDQYRSDPYDALGPAFQELASYFLMLEFDEYRSWKKIIEKTVFPYEDLLIQFAPEWGKILDIKKTTGPLSLLERRNILVSVINALMTKFAAAGPPIVLFTDDIQWIDDGSRQMLKMLLSKIPSKKFLFIAAYRQEEVAEDSKIWSDFFHSIRNSNYAVSTIPLIPFTVEQTSDFLSHTLNRSKREVADLASIVTYSTGGNPLQIREFLTTLEQEGTLRLESEMWVWDEKTIRVRHGNGSESLVQKRMERIDLALQEILVTAAAIGNIFTSADLSVASAKNIDEVEKHINEGIAQGFILYSTHQDNRNVRENSYMFTHDIIRQGFYNLIPDNHRPQFHLKIARRIENHIEKEKRKEYFGLAYHYNKAAGLLISVRDRFNLIQLNSAAARHAFSATAWEKAYEYSQIGIQIISKELWDLNYELILELLNTGIKSAFLSAHYDSMEAWIKIVETKAHSNYDKAQAWKVMVQSLVARRLLPDAVEAALNYSALLGRRIRIHPFISRLRWNMLSVNRFYNKAIGSTGEESKPVPHTGKISYLDILPDAVGASYLINQHAFSAITAVILKEAIRSGTIQSNGFAFICFGVVLIILGRYKKAIRMGEIGVRIAKNIPSLSEKAKVFMFSGILLDHWDKQLYKTVYLFKKGSSAGMKSGEYEYASYCLAVMNYYKVIAAREKLSVVEKEIEEALSAVKHMNQQRNIAAIGMVLQWVRSLCGKTNNPASFDGNGFSEQEHLQNTIKSKDKSHLATYYVTKCINAYLFGEYDNSMCYAEKAENIMPHIVGQAHYPNYYYIYGLTLLQKASQEHKIKYISKAYKYIRLIDMLSDVVPINYKHRSEFMHAELSRIKGRVTEAVRFYSSAIRSAVENGSQWDQGTIFEHAALFFKDLDMELPYNEYIKKARNCFCTWEARAKVQQLEKHHPSVFLSHTKNNIREVTPNRNDAFIQSTLAISQEGFVDQLLERFLDAVLRISGAEKAYLFEITENEIMYTTGGENKNGVYQFSSDPPCGLQYSTWMINYASKVEETVEYVPNKQNQFSADPYINVVMPNKIVCIPAHLNQRLRALLYVENSTSDNEYTNETLKLLESITIQAAITLERGRLSEREKHLEKINKEQLLQLMEAEKFASVGFLIAEIAHEVGNPNQSISLNAENLGSFCTDLITIMDELCKKDEFTIGGLDYKQFREEYPRIIESIAASSSQIDKLIKELKNFINPKTASGFAAVDINSVINSTLLIASHFINNATDQFSFQPGKLPDINGDFQKLQQVFLNLIRNACQALLSKDNALKISTCCGKTNSDVLVTIEDEGVGIQASHLEKICEPFFSTKHGMEGTGLGLYVSSSIIKQHGGSLHIESKEDYGTKVTVSFPVT